MWQIRVSIFEPITENALTLASATMWAAMSFPHLDQRIKPVQILGSPMVHQNNPVRAIQFIGGKSSSDF